MGNTMSPKLSNMRKNMNIAESHKKSKYDKCITNKQCNKKISKCKLNKTNKNLLKRKKDEWKCKDNIIRKHTERKHNESRKKDKKIRQEK